jgi:hypothetical protein
MLRVCTRCAGITATEGCIITSLQRSALGPFALVQPIEVAKEDMHVRLRKNDTQCRQGIFSRDRRLPQRAGAIAMGCVAITVGLFGAVALAGRPILSPSYSKSATAVR